ncbi:polysialyltransferase family glycosyltransferase [Pectobacterium versatile]|uniref:polysialyltransferase family glycosyltransferase n=1 Tax=Pectobacterium versatile TaxID=2488639 RepID=UPI00102E4553|nr:polysialyltransferase family glycosyltransferase [Pectobacterium versatile]TAI84934.1 hypothetical protein EG330_10780 [Pectobacterium versatile]
MSSFFLVRNLLSVKTAYAIYQQHKVTKEVTFSIEDEVVGYFDKIKSTVPLGVDVIPTKNINWLFERLNYLSNLKVIWKHEKDISELYENKKITDLFVHFPLHEKDALYVKVAKGMAITINFYEEGSCFYTGVRGRKKGITNEMKYWIKHLSLKLIGINRGYHVEPDQWYSIFPVKKINNKIINISYTGLDDFSIKYLFLSRPVISDFPSISLEQQLNAMLVFINRIPDSEVVYIKFHPRESSELRNQIIKKLRDACKRRLAIEMYEKEVAAEEIVHSMTDGGEVCGFDSSTLIYGLAINKKLTYSSVLGRIHMYDDVNELSNLYYSYIKDFPHINFI